MHRARVPIALAAALTAAAAALAACGSTTHKSAAASPRPTAHRTAAAPPTLRYGTLGTLPSPVQDAAGAPGPAGISVLAGGLSAADTSTDEVWMLAGARLVRAARLPGPQHDAQAAALGDGVYVFGGADLSQYDHVLHVGATGTVTSAGRLPSLASDVAAAAIGDTAYVVGGYTGTQPLSTIVAYRPGSPSRVVGRLPVALRYAAVAATAGSLIIAGGSTPAGASRDVYAFDVATGRVRRLARLARARTHAAAASLGSTVYLIGGRGDAVGTPTASILAIDPGTGAVRPAGRLPRALSDLTAVGEGGAILLYGGRTAAATVATVGRLSASG